MPGRSRTGQLTCSAPDPSLSRPHLLFAAQLFGVGLQCISPELYGVYPDPSVTWSKGLGKGDKPSTEGHTRGTRREATPSFLGPLNLVINRTTRSSDIVPSSFPQIRTSEAQKSSEPCPRSRAKNGPCILVPACHTALHPAHCGPSLTITPVPIPSTPLQSRSETTENHKDAQGPLPPGAHSLSLAELPQAQSKQPGPEGELGHSMTKQTGTGEQGEGQWLVCF